MIKASSVELQGARYHLFFSVNSMLTIEEKYGATYLEMLDGGGRDSLAATVGIFEIMATEGELARRRMGYDHGAMPEVEIADLTPTDWIKMRMSIMAAVNLGLEQEFEPDEDVDLILLEYQKKTDKEKSAPNI